MAGGQWRMVLPPASNPNVVLAANRTTQISPRPSVAALNASLRGFLDYGNLLGLDRPTVMTKWTLSSIYLPVAILPSNFPCTITLALELSVNGQVVWSQAQTFPFPVGPVTVASPIYSADLVNAVVLDRGSRVALDGYLTSDTAQNMAVGYGAQAGAGILPREGAIGYTVQQLTGARQL